MNYTELYRSRKEDTKLPELQLYESDQNVKRMFKYGAVGAGLGAACGVGLLEIMLATEEYVDPIIGYMCVGGGACFGGMVGFAKGDKG